MPTQTTTTLATPLVVASVLFPKIESTSENWTTTRQPFAADHPALGRVITDGIAVVVEDSLYAKTKRELAGLCVEPGQPFVAHLLAIVDKALVALPDATKWEPTHVTGRPNTWVRPALFQAAGNRRPSFGLCLAKCHWLVKHTKRASRIVNLGEACLRMFAILDHDGEIVALVMPVELEEGPFKEGTQ